MRMFKLTLLLPALISLAFLASCTKVENEPEKGAFSDGVFIVNEGPFQTGTGTITFFKPDSNLIRQDIFESVNGRPLGNIAQSLTILNGNAYIVINNADKVEVVDAKSFKSTGTITALKNPSQFLGISGSKAYVSNWDGTVAVIDLLTNTVSKNIAAGTGPDGMLKSGNYVFVANTGGFGIDSTLAVIDFLTDKIVKTIPVGQAPTGLVSDGNGKIWVLCKGKGFDGWPQQGDTPGKLLRIDPNTLLVDFTYNFTLHDVHPDKLVIDKLKTKVYFLYNYGIYRFNLTGSGSVPEKLVSRAFYSLGYEDKTGYLYAADAKNYVNDGLVLRINAANGLTIDSIPTGIIPRAFAFPE